MREKTGLSETDGDNWRISAITEAKWLVVVMLRYGQVQNACRHPWLVQRGAIRINIRSSITTLFRQILLDNLLVMLACQTISTVD